MRVSGRMGWKMPAETTFRRLLMTEGKNMKLDSLMDILRKKFV
jgi:hypothetical protein